jgi:3-hydroxyisobutyrate dehydrogenase-like beta-hydroxyacid dehydrogenase
VTTVGVVGTGRMGGAMARALAADGHDLILWNRTRAGAERLAAELPAGADVMDTPRDVAARADVVVSMLADGAAVDAVYGGADGLISGARQGTVLVDASTVAPSTLRAHVEAARQAGLGLVDAPVSGSVGLAERGQLTLMVGGDPAEVERARPVLESLGTTVIHLGPVGSGAAMKLAVNTVIFGLNEALAEALVLAEAAGIERARAYDVIAASAAASPFIGYKRAAFIEPDATPVAFALDLAAKDLGLIRDLADEIGVRLPQARTDLSVIRAAAGEANGGQDFSAVAVYLRESRSKEEAATG